MTETDDTKTTKRGGGKKNKKAFIYGNYKAYYGYRVDRNQDEDPRLAVFKKEWFEDKDCLDIGCNQGLITISIAKKFLCRSILGIDIDAGLIESAKFNLRKLARTGYGAKKQGNTVQSHVPAREDCLDKEVSQDSTAELSTPIGDASTSENGNFHNRVSFGNIDFVASWNWDGCPEKFDTILCLSVSKWIHLNWGDDGLVILFVKIWRLLRPGGIFVLEPQPWSSYKNNRNVSKTATMNFNSILIKPHQFREILLDKVGFRSVEIVTDSLSGTVAGFDRPIMVFVK